MAILLQSLYCCIICPERRSPASNTRRLSAPPRDTVPQPKRYHPYRFRPFHLLHAGHNKVFESSVTGRPKSAAWSYIQCLIWTQGRANRPSRTLATLLLFFFLEESIHDFNYEKKPSVPSPLSSDIPIGRSNSLPYIWLHRISRLQSTRPSGTRGERQPPSKFGCIEAVLDTRKVYTRRI